MLVPSDEQIKRLNAARFQLDIMDVGGIIVARTDAEAATLLDGRSDERDQPFILGATNVNLPSFKACYLTMLKHFHDAGLGELNGHLLYALAEEESAAASRVAAFCGPAGTVGRARRGLQGRQTQQRRRTPR